MLRTKFDTKVLAVMEKIRSLSKCIEHSKDIYQGNALFLKNIQKSFKNASNFPIQSFCVNAISIIHSLDEITKSGNKLS